MKNKQLCLVLGANGFIGSHLVDELAENGYRVRAFGRYSRDPQFKQNSNVELVEGDLFKKGEVKKALKGVDYVFHSFSATNPFVSDADPYIDIEKNLKVSVNIFEQSIKAKVKKVIFLSSGGAVYGNVAEAKTPSEEDATTPVSPYGISKLAIENYLAYFNRKFGLEYIVYRLSNPYGPRQAFKNHQGVIPAFLDQVQKNNKIVVYGDGTASRDFIYIRDMTKMVVGTFSKKTKYRTYNLGSGKQTSINQIIQTLKKVSHIQFTVKHKEEPKTFLKSAKLNVDRFTDEFKLSANTSLETGLTKTID